MDITITAFERSPDGGRGLAHDTRVRWALEEAGLPYAVRLVSFAAKIVFVNGCSSSQRILATPIGSMAGSARVI